MAALQAATISAARFLSQEDELGSVHAGKLADVVLLEKNPLESISHTRAISAVIIRGQLLDKTSIDEGLKQLHATHGNDD